MATQVEGTSKSITSESSIPRLPNPRPKHRIPCSNSQSHSQPINHLVAARAGNGDLDLRGADIVNTGTIGVGLAVVNTNCIAVDVGRSVDDLNVGDAEVGVDVVGGAICWDVLCLRNVCGTLEFNLDGDVAGLDRWSSQASAGEESGSGESEELHFEDWYV